MTVHINPRKGLIMPSFDTTTILLIVACLLFLVAIVILKNKLTTIERQFDLLQQQHVSLSHRAASWFTLLTTLAQKIRRADPTGHELSLYLDEVQAALGDNGSEIIVDDEAMHVDYERHVDEALALLKQGDY